MRSRYRAEKWPISSFFAATALAIWAASSAVECLVSSARFISECKKVDS